MDYSIGAFGMEIDPLKKKKEEEEALLDPMEQYRQQFVMAPEPMASSPAPTQPAATSNQPKTPAQPPTGPATPPQPNPAVPSYGPAVPPPPPPPPPPPGAPGAGPAQPPTGPATDAGGGGSIPISPPITTGTGEAPGVDVGEFTPAEAPGMDTSETMARLEELMPGRAPTPGEIQERTGGLAPELEAFAREVLANPSRWDQQLVQESLDLINQDTTRSRDAGQRAVSEQMAARGTLGSSIEWDDLNSLETQLAEIEAQRRNDLAREVANTTGADRRTAADIGLGVNQQAETRYQFDVQANLQRDAQALAAYQTDLNAGMQATQLRLQEIGMQSDEAFRYSQLAQDGDFRQRAMELQAEGMKLDEAFRQAELDLRGELGRGELAIREQEAQAQLQSMEVARFGVVADFMLRAIEAGIPPEQIEEAITRFLGGDENAFSGIDGGAGEGSDGSSENPNVSSGVTAPPNPRDGDVWRNSTTGRSYTYRNGQWVGEDGSIYMGGVPPV